MAVTETNYFANAIVGQPMAGADFDVTETHSTPRYAVGLGFLRSDGNAYRYVHAGADVNIAQAVATDSSESSVTLTNAFIAPATAGKPDFENINRGAINSHYIQSSATLSNNQMAGGYLCIFDDTANGTTRRIRGNTSWNGSTTDIELYEALTVAVDATSDAVLIGSPYANVEAATTSPDYRAVGVAQAGISANNYGWICTKGITTVNIGSNVTGGGVLVLEGHAGCLETLDKSSTGTATISRFQVGLCLETVAATASYAPARVSFE